MVWRSKNKTTFFSHFETHAQEILVAAKLLQQLLTDPTADSTITRQIKEHEHAADLVTHAVVRQLNTTFIHPIDREDILALTSTLDDVIDHIFHSAESFAWIFELSEATTYTRRFGEIIVHASEALSRICPLIEEPSRNLKEIVRQCVEIHRLENEGDDLRREALHTVYLELTANSLSVPAYLAWSEIYHRLEQVTDKAEDCANIVEQIAIKYG